MCSLYISNLLRHLLKRTLLQNDLFVIFHRKFVNGYVNDRTVCATGSCHIKSQSLSRIHEKDW